jgi:hypothetical protein
MVIDHMTRTDRTTGAEHASISAIAVLSLSLFPVRTA